ncbi:MAG: hypothetical protein CVU44_21575 [Chloroflexi bacterium HGW-Chloroflexi-6]|nr:MAG: hypothetical protein CVU44_21575 [Chloroflexi bacterium HGW-Chloroflexi-6]
MVSIITDLLDDPVCQQGQDLLRQADHRGAEFIQVFRGFDEIFDADRVPLFARGRAGDFFDQFAQIFGEFCGMMMPRISCEYFISA